MSKLSQTLQKVKSAHICVCMQARQPDPAGYGFERLGQVQGSCPCGCTHSRGISLHKKTVLPALREPSQCQPGPSKYPHPPPVHAPHIISCTLRRFEASAMPATTVLKCSEACQTSVNTCLRSRASCFTDLAPVNSRAHYTSSQCRALSKEKAPSLYPASLLVKERLEVYFGLCYD